MIVNCNVFNYYDGIGVMFVVLDENKRVQIF